MTKFKVNKGVYVDNVIYVDFKNKCRIQEPGQKPKLGFVLSDSDVAKIHARIDEIEEVMILCDNTQDDDIYCSLEDELSGLMRALQDSADADYVNNYETKGVSK